MADLIARSDDDAGSTNVSRFLANRGAIVIRESRSIGKLKGEHGDLVEAEAIVLSVVKGTKKERIFGVRLERRDVHGDTDSAVYLDYDELEELVAAIDFISSTAGQLSGQVRDYTEVTYSTKDGAKFGFYHSSEGQLAFVGLSEHRASIFLQVKRLPSLRQLLTDAQAHLRTCGASED